MTRGGKHYQNSVINHKKQLKMPHPKRRHSKTRRDKRRTHDKTVTPTTAICSNCGAPVLYHRVCPECGFYKGKPAIKKEVTV